jgi:hypothetical protein
MFPRPSLPALLLLAVLGLTACAGGSGSSAAAPGQPAAAGSNASTTTAAGDALKAYADCLSQHGVKVPADFGQRRGNGATAGATTASTAAGDTTAGSSGTPDGGAPGSGGGGGLGALRNDPNFVSAQQACQSLRPAGRNGAGLGNGANAQAFQDYQSCMKDNGITLPARGFGGPNSSTSTSSASPADPASTTAAPASPPSTVDRSSPAFQAANQKCQALLPPTTTTTAP